MQDSNETPHRGGGGTNDGTKPKGYRKPGQGKDPGNQDNAQSPDSES